jgi:hypothetical protein
MYRRVGEKDVQERLSPLGRQLSNLRVRLVHALWRSQPESPGSGGASPRLHRGGAVERRTMSSGGMVSSFGAMLRLGNGGNFKMAKLQEMA